MTGQKDLDKGEPATVDAQPEAKPMQLFIPVRATAFKRAPLGRLPAIRSRATSVPVAPGALSVTPPSEAIEAGKGVNQDMPKLLNLKVGIVTLTQSQTEARKTLSWRLRYRDPATGADIRRRLSGLTRDEAKAVAEHLTREALLGKGYLAKKPKAPPIADALTEAVRLANTTAATERFRLIWAKAFVRWLGEKYPAIRTWDELRPAVLQCYILELEEAGKAHDTVRLALDPVKLAWGHTARNFPDLVKPLTGLRQRPAPARGVTCLTASELSGLLAWLQERRPDLWAMAALQGLAGLRQMEAAALRLEDIDFDKATVAVVETPTHRPKTRASHRVIPVCGEALETVRWAVANQKIRPTTGELFTNARGAVWTREGLTLKWQRAKATIRRDGALDVGLRNRLAKLSGRRLRSAFVTLAHRQEVSEDLLRRYVGHAGRGVLEAHYLAVSIDDLRAVSDRMNGWREALTTENGWQESGNIAESAIATD